MTTLTYTTGYGNKFDAIKDANGIVRWVSNDRVPPNDVLVDFYSRGLITHAEWQANKAASAADLRAFIDAMRAEPHPITDEMRAEARAAHGPGVRMTNIITGEQWTT